MLYGNIYKVNNKILKHWKKSNKRKLINKNKYIHLKVKINNYCN